MRSTGNTKKSSTGSQTSLPFNSPTEKYYIILTGLSILAGFLILLAFILLAAIIINGSISRFGAVLAIDGATLATTLLGIYWYARRKKPPAPTAGDARIIGFRFIIAGVSVTFTSLVSVLLSEHHGSLLPSLLGGAVGLFSFWVAPAYWFWRAKRLTPS